MRRGAVRPAADAAADCGRAAVCAVLGVPDGWLGRPRCWRPGRPGARRAARNRVPRVHRYAGDPAGGRRARPVPLPAVTVSSLGRNGASGAGFAGRAATPEPGPRGCWRRTAFRPPGHPDHAAAGRETPAAGRRARRRRGRCRPVRRSRRRPDRCRRAARVRIAGRRPPGHRGGRSGPGPGRARADVRQRVVERLLVQAGRVERVAAAAVRQREPGGLADVLGGDLVAAVPGGQRDRGPGGDEVGAQAVDVEGRADGGDLAQRAIGQPHLRQPSARCDHAPGDPFGILIPARGEGQPGRPRTPAGGGPPRRARRVPGGCHLDGQPEPVEQLRAAARPPPGSWCRPAGTGPRAGPTRPRARRSSRRGPRRPAAGRPGGRAAG